MHSTFNKAKILNTLSDIVKRGRVEPQELNLIQQIKHLGRMGGTIAYITCIFILYKQTPPGSLRSKFYIKHTLGKKAQTFLAHTEKVCKDSEALLAFFMFQGVDLKGDLHQLTSNLSNHDTLKVLAKWAEGGGSTGEGRDNEGEGVKGG
ncbi:hypothetical protein PTI98_008930 [Pleurotus ostreatus]|nr:hypothetical protein PTI98_008930 [Pleurotus ostreatus]